jgi:hypothetical protein
MAAKLVAEDFMEEPGKPGSHAGDTQGRTKTPRVEDKTATPQDEPKDGFQILSDRIGESERRLLLAGAAACGFMLLAMGAAYVNVNERSDRIREEVTQRSDQAHRDMLQRSDQAHRDISQRSEAIQREMTERYDRLYEKLSEVQVAVARLAAANTPER